MALQNGIHAPDFTLFSAEGMPFTLSKDARHMPVVLFFYPKNFTGVCTRQACDLRDNYHLFEDMGIQVIGISGDKAENHKLFQSHYQLPFTLLSDPDHVVASRYGALYPIVRYPKRITYLLGPDHKVLFSYSNMLTAQGHRERVLAYLQKRRLPEKWQAPAGGR